MREVAAGGRYVHPTLGARMIAAEAEERKRAETHRARIMQKLRLTTRAELVRYALAHGLPEADEA